MKGAILVILLSLAPHKTDKDEPVDARRARLETIAEDIAAAADGRRDTAAALVTLGWRESRFARYVGQGCVNVPKGHANCDSGRARSYWQVWSKGCRPGWALPPGSREAQAAFAKCAGRLWRAARRRCGGTLFGAYSGYRSFCVWEPARKRAVWHRGFLGRI